MYKFGNGTASQIDVTGSTYPQAMKVGLLLRMMTMVQEPDRRMKAMKQLYANDQNQNVCAIRYHFYRGKYGYIDKLPLITSASEELNHNTN